MLFRLQQVFRTNLKQGETSSKVVKILKVLRLTYAGITEVAWSLTGLIYYFKKMILKQGTRSSKVLKIFKF